MSWLPSFPSFGEVLDGLSTAVDRLLARDEADRLRAQHAKLVYRVAQREAALARERAALEEAAEKLAALRAAEALYEQAEAERAATAADGREP